MKTIKIIITAIVTSAFIIVLYMGISEVGESTVSKINEQDERLSEFALSGNDIQTIILPEENETPRVVPEKEEKPAKEKVAAKRGSYVPATPVEPAGEMLRGDKKAEGCVFKTVFEGDRVEPSFCQETPASVVASIKKGLGFVVKEQNPDGGWSCGPQYFGGSGNATKVKIQSDPATTSMVSMALLRSGSTPDSGQYAQPLSKSLAYLIKEVENALPQSANITAMTGTQIQVKLGANIDAALTAQFFSNVLDYPLKDTKTMEKIKKCLDVCVQKIQKGQAENGSISGSGWAGVLQSSFATSALESAHKKGAAVDVKALQKSRQFQKGNYDASSGKVNTDLGAGVMLYSVSSTTRAAAKEARKVDEDFKKAKAKGLIPEKAEVNTAYLEKIGYSKEDAVTHATAYGIYHSAKDVSQQEDVLRGFGNNGGEEFLSFLQTGEGMIIGKDIEWKKWYNDISKTLLKIQNTEGSWNGHHCITSPVFCTATSVLILSINNDIDNLVAMGGN